ncbi:MAG: hypothetical protein Q9195_007025 [Heterodermia aff. obscurata]
MTELQLNDSRSGNPSTSDYIPTSREDRARKTAIHHAELLQQRKNTEMQILEFMEILIDYPTTTDSDAAQPSAENVTQVREMLVPFQPSDYDALVEERNINRKCGYVFCRNPNRTQGTKAKFGFLHTKGKGIKIVDQKVLERWCSPECGKRALYLRVQLDEVPAWERIGGVAGHIVLLDDLHHSPLEISRVAEGLNKLDIRDDEETLIAAMRDLAVERGDGNARANSTRIVNVNIIENTNPEQQQHGLPPKVSEQSLEAHELVEGYRPKKPTLATKHLTETDKISGQR